MKNQLNRSGVVLLLMALVLMLTEASVFAQRPGRGGEGQEGRGQRPRGGEQGEQGQRGQRGQGGRENQPSPLLRLFDVDRDGVVSTEEMNNAAAVLLKMDKDGDGSLSAEELRPQGGRRGQGGQRGGQGQRGPRDGNRNRGQGGEQQNEQSRRGGSGGDTQFANQLMELDIDGDGTLSRAELPEHMQVAFDGVDVNGDGVVSAEERLKLASKFRRNKLNPNGDTVKNAPTRGL